MSIGLQGASNSCPPASHAYCVNKCGNCPLAYRQLQAAGRLDQPTSLEVQHSVDFNHTVLGICVNIVCVEVWTLLPWWNECDQGICFP